MNERERLHATLNNLPTDFLPRTPVLMHLVADQAGISYGEIARNGAALAESNIALIEQFGFEQLDVLSDPWCEAADFGGKITYLDDTVPLCEHVLANTTDLSALTNPDPHTSPRMSNRLRSIKRFAAYSQGRYDITGWIEGPAAAAGGLRGISNFLMDTAMDPAFTAALLDVVTDNAIAFALAQIQAGATTIGIGDAIASQIGPAFYETLDLPRTQRIVDAIHDAGGFARLHICGDINHLLPLIAQTGIDMLDCDWQVDLAAARAAMPTTALGGGVDPVLVLNAAPDEIRAAVAKAYQTAGNPYVVMAGCEIPRGTPDANFAALCEPISYTHRE